MGYEKCQHIYPQARSKEATFRRVRVLSRRMQHGRREVTGAQAQRFGGGNVNGTYEAYSEAEGKGRSTTGDCVRWWSGSGGRGIWVLAGSLGAPSLPAPS